ncbi:MAG: sigma-54-dependent Fis family transcriptional regulator, partial [Bacteroidaceae bacterium]|nr:sigma-54-dependent Fis family transcriptional regulator [Bacteroidaceae bacterium]
CIPESLFESELFGHEKGAFTGATATKQGRVEEADGGTLFLDEIGNLSPLMQQKLLTMIEKREVSRVGSTKTRCIDVRIVAATNANLKAGVEAGTFRQDLLYRLNTIALHLPPLRERGEDILLLARHFMDHFARKYKMEAKAFSPQEEQTLLSYKWPGNVRELQHCMERWVIDPKTPLCKILQDEGGEDSTNHDTEGFDNSESHQTHFSLNLEELERQAIMEALKQSDGNLTQTAALLGITRYALYRKIDKYGLS